jgi:hypothetical protein
MRSSAAMLAVGDSVVIEVTLMNTDDSIRLLAVSGNHYGANSFLLTGGRLGKAYKSDEDGDNWTPSVGGTYYGPMRTVNALSWSHTTRFGNWSICMAACNKGIWFYDALSDYWFSLLQGDEYVFTATDNSTDSRGYESTWHIAGLRYGVPCLYKYVYFQGGSYISFREIDATAFENKITDMTNIPWFQRVAVTDGGEIGYGDDYRYTIAHDFDTSLYAACSFQKSYADSSKVFVAGENGFISYMTLTDPYTWLPVASGITSRINSMASNYYYDGSGNDATLLVAGGNGGQFSYSLDEGQTFIPYDIGFGTSNINDIDYYDYDGCFYAVGDHGKIARIKFTLE